MFVRNMFAFIALFLLSSAAVAQQYRAQYSGTVKNFKCLNDLNDEQKQMVFDLARSYSSPTDTKDGEPSNDCFIVVNTKDWLSIQQRSSDKDAWFKVRDDLKGFKDVVLTVSQKSGRPGKQINIAAKHISPIWDRDFRDRVKMVAGFDPKNKQLFANTFVVHLSSKAKF